jgi:cyclophilin family peptidyl-prolyl cis-trans isomerase
MARTSNRRQRETSRRKAQQAAEARRATTRRRQRWIAGAVAVIVVLGVIAAVFGSRSSSTSSPATSTSTTVASRTSSTQLPAGGIQPATVPMGASLTGATPCPAEDGSSPRTTLFAEAPPTCIDPDFFHIATITTTAGTMTVQLNPKLAPQTVNDFVVLARYHFYDGQPVTSITSRQSFTIGLAFTGEGADRAPGFTFPGDAAAQGTVLTPGALATGGPAGSAGDRGQLVVATYEDAAGIDPGVTAFGFMLSGDEVLSAVDALATQSGLPAAPVTITSITVTRSSAIPG